MSVSDFRNCTPIEFHHIISAWSKAQDTATRSDWERARMVAVTAVQPHCKGNLDPAKVLPLPWDKARKTQETLSTTDRKKRAEELRKRLGAQL